MTAVISQKQTSSVIGGKKHLEGEITPKEWSWLWQIAVKLAKGSENGNNQLQPGPES